MSNTIHPTAILEGNIQLGKGNEIGPFAVMRGNIILGDHNRIDSSVCIENNVRLGNNNRIYSFASIGSMGEMGAKGDRLLAEGKVEIGNDVTIREFVCIHSPVYTTETRVDDKAYLMNKSYVAHDCRIGRGGVLSAGVLLAGRCEIGEYANLGLGATVHQRTHIGKFAMVGMQTVITTDIIPYATVVGNPARILRFNRKGVEHLGYDEILLSEMEMFFFNLSHIDPDSDNPMIREAYEFLIQHPDSLVQVKP